MSIYDDLARLNRNLQDDEISKIEDRINDTDDEVRKIIKEIEHLKDTWKETEVDEAVETVDSKLDDFASQLEDISKRLY